MAITLGERTKAPAAIASGNEFLAENSAARGRWDDALAYAARDAEEGRKSGSLARVAWSEFSRVQALHGKGELAEALERTQAALELCAQIGEERLATWLDAAAALIAIDLANDTLARTHAQRGWARAQQLDQLVLSAWSLNALGYGAAMRGDSGEALDWYARYAALVRTTENGVARHLTLGRAAEAHFMAGHLADAARLADEAIAMGEFANAAHFVAVGRRVRGRTWVAEEKYGDARQAFDAAITQFDRLGSRLELARARLQRAALQLAQGGAAEREAARAEAETARAAFVAMGALRDATAAERLLGS